jgi:hypothetical protein
MQSMNTNDPAAFQPQEAMHVYRGGHPALASLGHPPAKPVDLLLTGPLLPGLLFAASVVIAAAAVLSVVALWPRGFGVDSFEVGIVFGYGVLGYGIGGLIAVLLVAALGRIMTLLETLAARGP